MPVKGTYTALQKLKPIDIDWGEVAESGNKREDILDKRKKEEAALRKVARDEIDYDTLEDVITGIDTLDKGIGLGIEKASTMQHEDFKIALNDPKYANSADYKIRTKNLNNYSKNIKAMTDATTELAGKLIAKSNDGTLSEWDNELLQTMNGAYVSEAVLFGVKEDGSVLTTIAMTDQELITEDNPRGFVKDEDGKIKMVQVTPSEIFKGLGMFSITQDVDIVDEAKIIGDLLGKSITSDIDGYTITSEQSWESKKAGALDMVKGKLGSISSPTALAKRLWADDMGRDSRKLTEDDMREIENRLLEIVKPIYDIEVEKTKNFAAQEKARGRHDDKTEGNITPEIVPDAKTGELEVVTLPNGREGYAVSFGDGKSISVKDTESEKLSYSNIYIDDDGNMFADKIEEVKYKGDPILLPSGETDWTATVAKQKAKGWEEKVEKRKKLTNVEITNLAKNSKLVDDKGKPFKDGKVFYDFLKDKKDAMPKNTKKSGGIGSKYNN